METTDIFDFSLIWNILSVVTFHLVTFGVCVFYVVRKQSADGFLLAAGSLIHLLTSILYTVVFPIMMRNSGISLYRNGVLMTAASAIGIIGSILFVTGFIILIINHLSLYKRMQGL